MSLPSYPILSCDEARRFEQQLFGGDETKEWPAMQRAGCAVANAVVCDFEELGGFPSLGRVLVLAGKGHNGGDALLAARVILTRFPEARADVLLVFGERALRPLALQSYQALVHAAPGRVQVVKDRKGSLAAPGYDLCLDGIFGFQFRPPVPARIAALLATVNALPVRLRAAVDLPSGVGGNAVFAADFTYATGCVKTPLLEERNAGRVRYLDLDFFKGTETAAERVLTREVLAPLAGLRAPYSDKRTYGHLFLIGGSRCYPGAVLMSVLAALRSGVGLVTAFVPESLVPAYAARAPEAMWVGWPETPEGGLALEGQHLLRDRWQRATALAIGPGLGREAETLALVTEIAKSSQMPLLLDADALQAGTVTAGSAPRILTPHAGEFTRIAGGIELPEFAAKTGATVVLKGPVTRISGAGKGGSKTRPTVYHSFFGGPVLARGGSGDLLAGLIGGLLAQTPEDPLLAAARGVVWHGLAADLLARAHGQTAVQTTQWLDSLPAVLRDPSA